MRKKGTTMNITEKQQKKAAKEFAEYWKGKGYEKGQSQKFWIDLLQNVYGVENATHFISFEDQVHIDKSTGFIDGYIESTKVMIEQKSLGKDLRKAIKQSDGTFLNPFQQAKRYIVELPVDKHPLWVITCNFSEFLIYDMNKPNSEPEQILLKDLPKEYYRLQFLVDTGSEHLKKEMEISLKAGDLVGKLYDAILKQYKNPESEETLKSLNMLCVRLVFCLYAEDAGIFGQHEMFGDYLKQFSPKDARKALIELFQVLDTKPEDRDPYMEDDLAEFPYVNGGLFADENIEIPRFTEEIVDLLVNKASAGFDWSEISPTIFGAVFESTLNPETRRSGGMHYTSLENIHKVIDPLFLDALKAELEEIKALKVAKTREQRLQEYRKKLSQLTFLDPAAGSGNFLTETYLSLRRLENEALYEENHGQMLLGVNGKYNPIQVSIGQFYGIEINDFAVTVAKTALWIAESQMMQETEKLMQINLNFLPLKSYANIVEGNALRIDWESVVPKEKLNYIMGNPPFVGHQWRSKSQVSDMELTFYDVPKHGKLDYVCSWYNKAADYMTDTQIKTAFVSTNSICQGESVGILWRHLFDTKKVEIQFAHQTFQWDSEASLKAHVHCVIIGFTVYHENTEKLLYSNGTMFRTKHINGYLMAAPNVFIQSRGKPLSSNMPTMSKGSQPTDGGNLILSEKEKNDIVKKYPDAKEFIKRYIGSDDFINNKYRYCLWLKDVSPSKYRKNTMITERISHVADIRKKSPTKSVQKAADIPMLFTQIRQPETDYLAVPEVSSEKRRYIPIGYLSADVIGSNKLYMISNATLYMFGVLTSNVHMAWMRVVAGRLEMRYSYSPAVYNNFPWCNPTPEQKANIEKTAQAILDARAKYPDCSLADLYDETTMPPELRKAHQANDFVVMAAYGFNRKITESECVAELMKRYQVLVK